MAFNKPDQFTHAYIMPDSTRTPQDERYLAWLRLMANFPRPTLLHHHPASSKCPTGSKHEAITMSGTEVYEYEPTRVKAE